MSDNNEIGEYNGYFDDYKGDIVEKRNSEVYDQWVKAKAEDGPHIPPVYTSEEYEFPVYGEPLRPEYNGSPKLLAIIIMTTIAVIGFLGYLVTVVGTGM